MIKIWDITVPPLTGKKKRRAYVYVPDSYYNNPDLRYPVLYMFDGHNVFFDSHASYGRSWRLIDYLSENQTQIIVAAVECNHGKNNARLSEYSPWTFENEEFGYVQGKGKVTMRWFLEEFKPYIDANYPTLPGRETTFIGGSSMGGLMSIYALLEHNDVFSGAIALSPSIFYSADKVKKLVKNAKVDKLTDLYVDVGEHELDYHNSIGCSPKEFIDLLQDLGMCVTARVIPGGDHTEASWERQMHIAIPILLYRMNYTDIYSGAYESGGEEFFEETLELEYPEGGEGEMTEMQE